jgi:signal transduction histidine kinase
MDGSSPLLPLVGSTILLLALIGIVVFVVLRFRKDAQEDRGVSVSERLSEEAFAAATIQAALAGRAGASPRLDGPAAEPIARHDDAAVLDALAAAIVVTDEAGVVRRVNPAARARLGIIGPGTGHPYRASFDGWTELADAFGEAHRGSRELPFTIAIAGPDGRRLSATLDRWAPAGGRGGAFAVLADVVAEPPAASPAPAQDSAQARGPAAAVPTLETATTQEVAAEVSRLASGLAHELANSLTTVHGYAHLVDRSGLSEADRTAVDHIKLSAESMLSTVDAFRGLVRPLPITSSVFSADALAREGIALGCQEAGADPSRVQLEVASSGSIEGDQVLLEEVVAAIVRNALEAAPSPVQVRVTATDRAVTIAVTDAGRGVAPELRHRLFHPFHTNKAGHAGLGLARAAHVARAHAGVTITVTHPETGGLAVVVALPRHA